MSAYHTVATPYLRLVKTAVNQHINALELKTLKLTLVAVEHLDVATRPAQLFGLGIEELQRGELEVPSERRAVEGIGRVGLSI